MTAATSPPASARLRVLLTGASGELGLALGNALTAAGCDVRGVDIRPSRDAAFPIECRDLTGEPLAGALLADRDVVVHLACHARAGTAPAEVVLDENAACDRAVLEAASRVPGVRTIIAASSCRVFAPVPAPGEPPTLPAYVPFDGHMRPAPNDAYGASKLATEQLMRALAARDPGRGYIALRLPRVIAPRHEAGFFRWPFKGAGAQEAYAFLMIDELAPLVLAIARAGLTGYRSYYPAARENALFAPAHEVIRQAYPAVPLRRPLEQIDALVDTSEITRDTGWSPRPSLRGRERVVPRARLELEARLGRRIPDLSSRVRRLVDRARRALASAPDLGAAQLVCDARAALGEGPFWHAREGALYWVDIPGKALHRHRPGRGDDVMTLPEWPSAVFAGPADEVLVALRDRLAWVDFERRTVRAHDSGRIEAPPSRLNDGKHDPRGRLWIGSTHITGELRCGALFRVDGGGVARVLDGIGCSNGLAWSADGATMYYIDSHDRGIDAFDYDLARGVASARRRVFTVPRWLAGPDGMCIDLEGSLWVALHGDGAVLRLDPRDGRILGRVAVPTARVTSCAFGGPDLSTLFITTADDPGVGGRGGRRAREPGGGLYAFDSPVRGAPVPGAGAPTLP